MSKPLTDRQGATEIVASGAETHAARVAEKFTEIFGDCLEGKEKMPDVALTLRLLARKQRRMTAVAAAADAAYEKELGDDAEPRDRRDAAANKLVTEIGEIRDTLSTAFGAAFVREIGLDGRVDTDPKAVLAKAKKLVGLLEDPKHTWPKAKRKGVKINPSEWAPDLKAPLSALERALGDVAREVREAQAASDARNRAFSENDDMFSRVAGATAAILRAVGDDALAARVRPSSRRPGQVAVTDEAAQAAATGDGAASPEGSTPEGS